MAGYTRQSIADIVNGLDITAPPLTAEFNQIDAAFHGSTGHSHDGGTGNAPKINLATAVQGYLPAANGGLGGINKIDATVAPATTNDNLQGYVPGSIWINVTNGRTYRCIGNATSAAVWREEVMVQSGNQITPIATNTVDLGTSSIRFKDAYLGSANTTGAATVGGNLTVTGTATLNGTTSVAAITASGQATFSNANVTGGTIDGATVGATTASTVRGTTITATTGFSGPLAGAVTGNVTGNLTGNVTGDVTGNLTGNVTAAAGTSSFNDVTINGSLNMNSGTAATVTGLSTPVNATDAATKSYVDTADALKLNLSGGTMSGALAMGANKITGLGTPTATTDAATKAYVDTSVSNVNPASIAITGGTINGTTVGATTSSTGAFTSLAASSLTLGGTAITANAAQLNSSSEDVNAENRIINGDFGIWQRGQSSTASGYVAADRWLNSFLGGTVTQARFALAIPLGVTSPPFSLSQTVSGQTLASHFATTTQKVESVRSYAGQTITVLGWARRLSGAGNMAVDASQNFGTGGSPSATVPAISPTTVGLTTSFAPFAIVINVPSISGKTIGTDGNDALIFNFWTSAGSDWNARTNSLGLQAISVNLWGIHIRVGTWTAADAALYRPRDPGTEVTLCQRYYEQARGGSVAYASSAAALQRFFVKYCVPKRIAAPSTTATIVSGSATSPTVLLSYSDGAFLSLTSTASSQDIVALVAADAEL